MSVLLDALKKAALEKKKRDDVRLPSEHRPGLLTQVPVVGTPVSDEQADENVLADDEGFSLDVDFDQFEKTGEPTGVTPSTKLPIPDNDGTRVNSPSRTHAQPAGEDPLTQLADSEGEISLQSAPSRPEPVAAAHPAATETEVQPQRERATGDAGGKSKSIPAGESLVQQQRVAQQKQAFNALLEKNRRLAKSNRRKFTVLLVLGGILSCSAVGAYYYYVQVNDGSMLIRVPSSISANNRETSGAENGESAVTSLNDSDLANIEPANIAAGASFPQSITAPETENTAKLSITPQPTTASLREQDKAIKVPAKPLNIKPPSAKSPLVSASPPKSNDLNEALTAGYSAYTQGDLRTAAGQYQIALNLDPINRDALLGNGAIAMAQRRYQDALGFYQQVLERTPRDEYAHSGIVAIAGVQQISPELMSKVNTLLQNYPQSAHLHFLKGALNAAQYQWRAAQTAFFNAWSLAPQRGDYAYNLAIALDHIRQPQEALRFYKTALSPDMHTPIPLDITAIQKRIAQLESMHE